MPSPIARHIANWTGYRVSRGAGIGLSWIDVDMLSMAPGSRIGHFNRLKGPFTATLADGAVIESGNTIIRARRGVAAGESTLRISENSRIEKRHMIDLLSDVTIGRNTIVGGRGSQLWTHGYVHDREGPGRYRIDGPIEIGDRSYIGPMSLVLAGVTIGDDVIVMGGTVIAKDLGKGSYGAVELRELPRPQAAEARFDLAPVLPPTIEDVVYRKRRR